MNFIKRDWKAFTIWVRNHRVKAWIFFLAFIALAIYAAEEGIWPVVIVYISMVIVFAIMVHQDTKALILLICSLLILPKFKAQEPPEPGGIAVGCAVVVIGGVAVYYMYSFCKKHFPKPDTNQVSHLMGDATFAACQQSFNGYCLTADNETIIRGVVGTSMESITVCQTYDREEFQSYLTSLGLPVGQLGTFHAINGQPCEPWQSPIQFTANGITIAGSNPRTNIVERSHDLVEWTPILTNIAPANLKFKFTDNSDAPQTYYRIKP